MEKRNSSVEGHKAAEILTEMGVRRIHLHTDAKNYANNFRRLVGR